MGAIVVETCSVAARTACYVPVRMLPGVVCALAHFVCSSAFAVGARNDHAHDSQATVAEVSQATVTGVSQPTMTKDSQATVTEDSQATVTGDSQATVADVAEDSR